MIDYEKPSFSEIKLAILLGRASGGNYAWNPYSLRLRAYENKFRSRRYEILNQAFLRGLRQSKASR